MADFTIEEMVEEAERVEKELPDPPGQPFSLPPHIHRQLVADVRPNTDPEDVEYCAECWVVVDGEACPECGSTERYDFE